MKVFKSSVVIIFISAFLLSLTSCVVLSPSNNGNHKGWFKNTNNPHNPNSTNPGKAKGKSKK